MSMTEIMNNTYNLHVLGTIILYIVLQWSFILIYYLTIAGCQLNVKQVLLLVFVEK